MTTLLSFLGKSQKQSVNGKQGGYRVANYQFSPESTRTEKYFGLALMQEIQPDSVVLIGTPSSSWDVFFLDTMDNGENVQEDTVLKLMSAVDAGAVTDGLLQSTVPYLANVLGLAPESIKCKVISVADTEASQVSVLKAIAGFTMDEDLIIDVTHGYRHLPMITMVAAQYLKYVKNVNVKGLFYAALDMTENDITPVLNLSGMLSMLDWIDALAAYDKSGDYALFSPLLQKETGEEVAELVEKLEKASYLEQCSNAVDAANAIKQVRKGIQKATVSPMAELFSDELDKRLSWVDKPNPAEREMELAKNFLNRGDYLRAATLMQEAFITGMLLKERGNPSRHADRDEARKRLQAEHLFFKTLSELRNALAHGQRVQSDGLKKTLENPGQLKRKLNEIKNQIQKNLSNT